MEFSGVGYLKIDSILTSIKSFTFTLKDNCSEEKMDMGNEIAMFDGDLIKGQLVKNWLIRHLKRIGIRLFWSVRMIIEKK